MMNMYVKQLKCHGFCDKTKNNDGLSHLADDVCANVPFVADAKRYEAIKKAVTGWEVSFHTLLVRMQQRNMCKKSRPHILCADK